MDELTQKSLLALEQAAEVSRQRSEQRQSGLTPKTFQGVDADQGQLILGDAQGGQANASSQGGLSNAAIATGKTVSSYGWDIADWKPTNSAVGGEDLTQSKNNDSFENQGAENEALPLRCQCHNVWVRGTPKRNPLGQEPVNELVSGTLEYEFFNLVTNLWDGPLTRDVFTPYEIVDQGPGSPLCQAVSPEGCIIAQWDGGSVQLTGTQQPGRQPDLAVRDLDFTADPEEDTEGPDGDTDPGEWVAVAKVCKLPASWTQTEAGSQLVLKVFDAEGVQVAKLGYAHNTRLNVVARCEEDGPPT